MYISKKVFAIVLAVIVTANTVIITFILNHNSSVDYIIATEDMFSDMTMIDNDNILHYDRELLLKYDQNNIDLFTSSVDIGYDVAAKIAEDMVFSYLKNEVLYPCYIYYDKDNGVYIVLSRFRDKDNVIKVIIDKNTGGVLYVAYIRF